MDSLFDGQSFTMGAFQPGTNYIAPQQQQQQARPPPTLYSAPTSAMPPPLHEVIPTLLPIEMMFQHRTRKLSRPVAVRPATMYRIETPKTTPKSLWDHSPSNSYQSPGNHLVPVVVMMPANTLDSYESSSAEDDAYSSGEMAATSTSYRPPPIMNPFTTTLPRTSLEDIYSSPEDSPFSIEKYDNPFTTSSPPSMNPFTHATMTTTHPPPRSMTMATVRPRTSYSQPSITSRPMTTARPSTTVRPVMTTFLPPVTENSYGVPQGDAVTSRPGNVIQTSIATTTYAPPTQRKAFPKRMRLRPSTTRAPNTNYGSPTSTGVTPPPSSSYGAPSTSFRPPAITMVEYDYAGEDEPIVLNGGRAEVTKEFTGSGSYKTQLKTGGNGDDDDDNNMEGGVEQSINLNINVIVNGDKDGADSIEEMIINVSREQQSGPGDSSYGPPRIMIGQPTTASPTEAPAPRPAPSYQAPASAPASTRSPTISYSAPAPAPLQAQPSYSSVQAPAPSQISPSSYSSPTPAPAPVAAAPARAAPSSYSAPAPAPAQTVQNSYTAPALAPGPAQTAPSSYLVPATAPAPASTAPSSYSAPAPAPAPLPSYSSAAVPAPAPARTAPSSYLAAAPAPAPARTAPSTYSAPAPAPAPARTATNTYSAPAPGPAPPVQSAPSSYAASAPAQPAQNSYSAPASAPAQTYPNSVSAPSPTPAPVRTAPAPAPLSYASPGVPAVAPIIIQQPSSSPAPPRTTYSSSGPAPAPSTYSVGQGTATINQGGSQSPPSYSSAAAPAPSSYPSPSPAPAPQPSYSGSASGSGPTSQPVTSTYRNPFTGKDTSVSSQVENSYSNVPSTTTAPSPLGTKYQATVNPYDVSTPGDGNEYGPSTSKTDAIVLQAIKSLLAKNARRKKKKHYHDRPKYKVRKKARRKRPRRPGYRKKPSLTFDYYPSSTPAPSGGVHSPTPSSASPVSNSYASPVTPAPNSYGSPGVQSTPTGNAYGSPVTHSSPPPSSYGSPVTASTPAQSSYGSPVAQPVTSSYGSPVTKPSPASDSYGSPVPSADDYDAPNIEPVRSNAPANNSYKKPPSSYGVESDYVAPDIEPEDIDDGYYYDYDYDEGDIRQIYTYDESGEYYDEEKTHDTYGKLKPHETPHHYTSTHKPAYHHSKRPKYHTTKKPTFHYSTTTTTPLLHDEPRYPIKKPTIHYSTTTAPLLHDKPRYPVKKPAFHYSTTASPFHHDEIWHHTTKKPSSHYSTITTPFYHEEPKYVPLPPRSPKYIHHPLKPSHATPHIKEPSYIRPPLPPLFDIDYSHFQTTYKPHVRKKSYNHPSHNTPRPTKGYGLKDLHFGPTTAPVFTSTVNYGHRKEPIRSLHRERYVGAYGIPDEDIKVDPYHHDYHDDHYHDHQSSAPDPHVSLPVSYGSRQPKKPQLYYEDDDAHPHATYVSPEPKHNYHPRHPDPKPHVVLEPHHPRPEYSEQEHYDDHYGHDDEYKYSPADSYIPTRPKENFDLRRDLLPGLDDVASKFSWDVKDFGHWGSFGPGFNGADSGGFQNVKFKRLSRKAPKKDPRKTSILPTFHGNFEEEEDTIFEDPYHRKPRPPFESSRSGDHDDYDRPIAAAKPAVTKKKEASFDHLIGYDRPAYKYPSQIASRRSGTDYDEVDTEDYEVVQESPPPPATKFNVDFEDWLSKFGVNTTTELMRGGGSTEVPPPSPPPPPRRRRLIFSEQQQSESREVETTGAILKVKEDIWSRVVSAMKRTRMQEVDVVAVSDLQKSETTVGDKDESKGFVKSSFDVVSHFASALMFGKRRGQWK